MATLKEVINTTNKKLQAKYDICAYVGESDARAVLRDTLGEDSKLMRFIPFFGVGGTSYSLIIDKLEIKAKRRNIAGVKRRALSYASYEISIDSMNLADKETDEIVDVIRATEDKLKREVESKEQERMDEFIEFLDKRGIKTKDFMDAKGLFSTLSFENQNTVREMA